MIYRIRLIDLIFSFALIMEDEKRQESRRAIAFSLFRLEKYLNDLDKKRCAFVSKEEFLDILNFFYQKISNKKIKKLKKDKLWRRFFRGLVRKKKLIITNKITKSEEEVIILSTSKGFIIF